MQEENPEGIFLTGHLDSRSRTGPPASGVKPMRSQTLPNKPRWSRRRRCMMSAAAQRRSLPDCLVLRSREKGVRR